MSKSLFNPTGFLQLLQNPLNNALMPILQGIALGEQQASRQIGQELQRYQEEHKQENDELNDRLYNMQVSRLEKKNKPVEQAIEQSDQQDQQNIHRDNIEQIQSNVQQIQEISDQRYDEAMNEDISDSETDSEEAQLINNLDLVLQNIPENGREILEPRRDQILRDYKWLLGLVTTDTAIKLGQYLWELVVTKDPVSNLGQLSDKPQGHPLTEKQQKKFQDKNIPVHCRREYYYDTESGKVKSMLVCQDTSNQVKRIYYDK